MTYPQAPPKTNKWLVAVTVMLPVFIQIMDTSVVNVSLPHIQGSLSAGLDEVTWSLTSYLAANAVIIPVTGWLASVLGRKRYLLLSLALFGTLVLLPLYLQKLMNYTALWAGLVLGPGGVASFVIMPLVGALLRKGVNPRDLLGFGLSVAAVSIWLMSRFNLEAGFWAIAEPRLLLGVGMGLFFVPLSTATFIDIRNEEMGNATAIFNVLRNLGQSFGVAVSTTILAQRAQVHQSFLVERITPFDPAFQTHYQRLLAWLQSFHPEMADMNTALGFMYREVLRQANMLAFNDVFWILACMTALLVPLTLLFKAPGRERR